MNLKAYYAKKCARGEIEKDTNQIILLNELEKIVFALISEQQKCCSWRKFFHRRRGIQGLYIWGGVGTGKTFMMDCFYHCLPFRQKKRVHFHQFMRGIHNELNLHQGEADPLQAIAKELARDNFVLCFDEFFVSDIADAMVLGRLLKAFFDNHICVVSTSNISPDGLYKNGLQRLQFLPTIELIKKYLNVFHLPSTLDYRLRYLQKAGVFYTPLDNHTKQNMQTTFELLAKGKASGETSILVNGRDLAIKKKVDKIIWFDFAAICQIPRSSHDYLVIVEQYHTVFISDVPVIRPEAINTICLFINLIDIFYDAHIKLVMSAAKPVSELYTEGHMVLEYARTHSRLLQMQTLDYFLNN